MVERSRGGTSKYSVDRSALENLLLRLKCCKHSPVLELDPGETFLDLPNIGNKRCNPVQCAIFYHPLNNGGNLCSLSDIAFRSFFRHKRF